MHNALPKVKKRILIFFSAVSAKLCYNLLDIQVLGGRQKEVNTNWAVLCNVLFNTYSSIAPKDSQAKAVFLLCSTLSRGREITVVPQRVYSEAAHETEGVNLSCSFSEAPQFPSPPFTVMHVSSNWEISVFSSQDLSL